MAKRGYSDGHKAKRNNEMNALWEPNEKSGKSMKTQYAKGESPR